MAISMVRKPSADYIVRSGAEYYAESDVNLTSSLGTTTKDYYALLENIVYGKITIDNITYLVSTTNMEMLQNTANYNTLSNIDDIIPFRYAYGNQNGYVIGKGTEVSHTVNGNQFTVNSGRLVIQGVESDIDANGITLTIDTAGETRYYVVYYEVNLATNTANIKLSNFDTVGYPNIDAGDDLTANSSGIARLPLYQFTAKNGVISSVKKVVNAIDYTGTALVGYDNSKGTVEERLTKLGFKQGSIAFTGGQLDFEGTVLSSVSFSNIATNEFKRQGNYIIAKFEVDFTAYTPTGSTISVPNAGSIPVEFIPKTSFYLNVGTNTYIGLSNDGTISFQTDAVFGGYASGTIYANNIGYEANPL